MSKVKWIKIETDIIKNRKIQELRDMKNGNDRVLFWLYLIILAGQCNDNGKVYFAQNVPYDDAKFQRELGISKMIIKSSLDYFQANSMIELDSSGIITLIGWNEYQNADALERQRENNNKRQREWYDKHKKPNAQPNKNLTQEKRYHNGVDVDVEEERRLEGESLTPFVKEDLEKTDRGNEPTGVIVPSTHGAELTQAMKSPNYQSLKKYHCFNPIILASYAGVIASLTDNEMQELGGVMTEIDNCEFPLTPNDVTHKVARWVNEHHARKE